jgi:hypothetical protein
MMQGPPEPTRQTVNWQVSSRPIARKIARSSAEIDASATIALSPRFNCVNGSRMGAGRVGWSGILPWYCD